jgi:hypothetical protein
MLGIRDFAFSISSTFTKMPPIVRPDSIEVLTRRGQRGSLAGVGKPLIDPECCVAWLSFLARITGLTGLRKATGHFNPVNPVILAKKRCAVGQECLTTEHTEFHGKACVFLRVLCASVVKNVPLR